MDEIEHFLAMGGYARFVWPAFGLAVLVMGGLAIESVVTYRKRQRELAAAEHRQR
jgi:heme exporter protein D